MNRTRIGALASAFLVVLVVGAATGSAAPGAGPRPSIRPAKRVCTGSIFRSADCAADVVANANGSPLAGSSPAASALGPSQFHTAYGLPTTGSSGATIAIVDAYDDPAAESDLAAYDAQYGLPACTTANGCFRKVNQTGGTSYPASNSGWALEISLDVQIAHAICQDCKILLVEASSSSLVNLGTAENEAVALGANAISNSFGATEYSSETSDEATYFHHPGVAITASTGDGGYGVEFPAASRYVTAVGGTTLSLGSGGSYLGETAWSGAGSGCSTYIPKPVWQTDTGCTRRSLADVSADADPNTGAAVYDSVPYSGQTGWFQVGGTSLASPLIAATYLLAGSTAGIQNGSGLYAHAALLHDVTSGSNGSCSAKYLCTAGVGYDGPTGLGTPNGAGAFASAGAQPAQDFSLGASPVSQTVTAGTGTSFTIGVSRTGGFSGTVTLTLAGLPNGASFAFAPAQVGSGTASSTLTVNTTAGVAPGSYSLTVTGTSGSTIRTTTATLVVSAPTASDFSIGVSPASQSVAPGGSTNYTVSLSRTGGLTGNIALTTSTLPSGFFASFSPASVSGTTSALTLTTGALTAPGSYPFTITGTSGSLVHSVAATLVVQGPVAGDFSLSVSPSSPTVPSTGTTTVTVTVTPSGGFSGQVTLTTGIPPFGVGLSFSQNPTASTSILTLTTSGFRHLRAPTRITITGTSGALLHSVILSINA